jgi:hypothetical protein
MQIRRDPGGMDLQRAALGLSFEPRELALKRRSEAGDGVVSEYSAEPLVVHTPADER